MLNTLQKWILCIKNMKQMEVHLNIQRKSANILFVLYLLAAILNNAAIGYQGGLQTCFWFLKIS